MTHKTRSLAIPLALAPGLVTTLAAWLAAFVEEMKRSGFVAASVVFLLAAVSLLGARALPLGLVFVSVAVAGVGYAGVQLFPLAMLPDTIAADTMRTGHRRSGVFTGVWTAGETAGFALGPAIFAMVLSVGGYVSSTSVPILRSVGWRQRRLMPVRPQARW